MTLDEVKVGDTGRISGFGETDLPFRRKLLAMGLTPGTEFTVRRVAPLGDPIELNVRGFQLSMRRKEVATVEVKLS
ncbi:Fe(2+) transport protein A [invertebrate metagenome]|uniref:Fe(2+) transport protein A n=1 Tax=invertebrate metagenome TaxID=1711999 RepID=A0A2H9TA70_9ZZZZ